MKIEITGNKKLAVMACDEERGGGVPGPGEAAVGPPAALGDGAESGGHAAGFELLVGGGIGSGAALGDGVAPGDETVRLSFCPSEQCWLNVQM